MTVLKIEKKHRILTRGRTQRPPKKSGQWIRKDKRRAIYLLDDCKCRLCGRTEAQLKAAGTLLSLDHLICWSDWGSNDVHNLITLCMECNNKRNDTSIQDFIVGKSDKFVAEIVARLAYDSKELAPYKVAAKFWIANGEDINNYPKL